MHLTKAQRELLRSEVLPKLATLGLRGTITRYVNPEDGVSAEDCLLMFGSEDGPYHTSKRVGGILVAIDDAFANLLIMKGLDPPGRGIGLRLRRPPGRGRGQDGSE